MKILYLAMDYPPSRTPGIWRTLAMSKYMAQAGHELTILCADKIGWQKGTDDTLCQQIPCSAKVIRLKNIAQSDIMPCLKRAAQKLTKIWQPFGKLTDALLWRIGALYPDPFLIWGMQATVVGLYQCWRYRPDCIISTGPPHTTHMVGLAIRSLFSTKWVVEYRDLWNDDPKLSYQTGYRARLFSWLEKVIINRADAVVCVSPYWLDILKGHKQLTSSTLFQVIRNGHDLDFEQIKLLKTLGVKKTDHSVLTLHFHGSVYEPPVNFLDALQLFNEQYPSLASRLKITFIDLDKEISAAIGRYQLNHCIENLQTMSHLDGISHCLSVDCLLLFTVVGNDINKGTIPGKTYEYLALGKPIFCICMLESDVATLIRQAPNAILCDIDNIDSIVDGFHSLMQKFIDGELRDTSTSDWEGTFPLYTRQSQANEMMALLKTLVNQ